MPNSSNQQTIWTPQGTPDETNISVADWDSVAGQRGQLGVTHDYNSRMYQRVKLDSGATSATPTGAVAANDIAFWRFQGDSAVQPYTVTNDRRFAMNLGVATAAYANFVAGVFRMAVTAGHYCDILVKGSNIPVADGGNTFAAGELVFAELDSAAAVDRVGVGTYPSYLALGRARGAAAGGFVNVDIDIPLMAK
jgi:hypothetical protein